jgi:hypothetical protein
MKNPEIVLDNFFPNPHMIRMRGLFSKYYNKDTHPDVTAINQFPGIRTIDVTDKWMNKYAFDKISKALLEHGETGKPLLAPNHFRLNYSLTFENTRLEFHYDEFVHTTGNNREDDLILYPWQQRNYAGVVYLNPKVDSSYGTTIICNNKKYEVENIFNRMVIYPTKVYHSLSGTFGKNRFDGRMVLTLYIKIYE